MKRKIGKLIVIDGTDGSGKGTQTELMVKRLKEEGHKVRLADFPQYGERSATMTEDYLTGKYGSAEQVGAYRASIFYACDRFDASFKIRKWLNDGEIVISNRYVSSSMGHQAGKIKNKRQRNRFLKWLHQLEFDIFKIPKPNATILLYVPVKIGQELIKRKGNREYLANNKTDIHETNIPHLEDAAKAYLDVARKYKWTILNCAPEGTLRSLKSIEDIHQELYHKVQTLL